MCVLSAVEAKHIRREQIRAAQLLYMQEGGEGGSIGVDRTCSGTLDGTRTCVA